MVAEEEGEEPDRFHPNQSSPHSPGARARWTHDAIASADNHKKEKEIRNLLYGEMKDMGFFLRVFQRGGPSDETGSTHTGYYSNETPKKLATQPQEAEAPHSLPPPFFFAPLPPPPSACCAIIARHFNKASRRTTGLRRCHFCSLRWQETSHYGRHRRAGEIRLASAIVATAIDSLVNRPPPPRKVIKKRTT